MQNLFLTNLDTHVSGIDRFYSSKFTVAVAAVRIRSYIPPPVHDEIDVFDNEVDDRVGSYWLSIKKIIKLTICYIFLQQFASLSTQLVYDAVVLFYNAVLQLSQHTGFYTPQFSCGRGFWQPGPHLVQQMKKVWFKEFFYDKKCLYIILDLNILYTLCI